jgi:hypothetical protein
LQAQRLLLSAAASRTLALTSRPPLAALRSFSCLPQVRDVHDDRRYSGRLLRELRKAAEAVTAREEAAGGGPGPERGSEEDVFGVAGPTRCAAQQLAASSSQAANGHLQGRLLLAKHGPASWPGASGPPPWQVVMLCDV